MKDDDCITNVIKIANACIDLEYWPNDFKISSMIIIPKPNKLSYDSPKSFRPIVLLNTLGKLVVATTCWNSTCSLLTSVKLTEGYLAVGITRELNKEPLLYYPLYIYMAPGPCYNNIYPALKSICLSHVLLLIHMCFP